MTATSHVEITAPAPILGTELLLVRHGEGTCNAAGIIGGDAGCHGLTEAGLHQCRAVCLRLEALHAQRPFHHVACSPRRRVRQSASLMAAWIGLEAHPVHDLRGQDFGQADGRSWRAVTAEFGGVPASDPDRPVAEGAEPWNVYAARVLAAVTELLNRHAGRRVLLVAHGKTAGLTGALLSGERDPASVAERHVVRHGALAHWRVVAGPDGAPSWLLLPSDETP